jgi:hypothetical protein
VPVAFTLGVAVVPPLTIPAPAQLKVAPEVEDEPFKVTVEVEQVMVCVVPAFAFGATVLVVTDTVDVATQPLAGLVTVKVNVPAALTVGVAVVPPLTMPVPAQLNVAPVVDDDPFKTGFAVVQVIVLGVPALAFGATVLDVTVTVEVAVQLFVGLVTVKV